MSTHGTPLSTGQRANFLAAGAKALALIADELPKGFAAGWAHNGEAMQKALLSILSVQPGAFCEPAVNNRQDREARARISMEFREHPLLVKIFLERPGVVPSDFTCPHFRL